jgi:putative transcriptional regulator
MKLRTNLQILLAEKGQRERRRISLRQLAQETNISYRTVLLASKDELREIPVDVVEKLCGYFGCEPGALFYLDRGKEG